MKIHSARQQNVRELTKKNCCYKENSSQSRNVTWGHIETHASRTISLLSRIAHITTTNKLCINPRDMMSTRHGIKYPLLSLTYLGTV